MANVAEILTDNLDIWTSAIGRSSTAGRGQSRKFRLYGIKKLRALILDLAVRGKLVPQDPNDEPASELLKKITHERGKPAAFGKASKATQTKTPPFVLPKNWKWVQLSDITLRHYGGGTPSKMNQNYWGGDILWASVKDVGKQKYIYNTEDRITELGLAESPSNLIDAGALIIVTRMGLGQISINQVPMAINQDLRAIFPTSFVDINFVYNFFLTQKLEGAGLTVKGIRIEELFSIQFPLPPLAEQHRIVAKVDELMSLCDALEAQTYGAIEAHELLVGSLLATLTRSQNAKELAENWARVEAHFDALFTTEASVDQLKKTILQLAVMGKLVPQDPSDEPASVLLKQITKEVISYSKSEGIRPPQPDEIDVGQEPFALPQSWKWVRLCSLFRVITDGDHQPPPKSDSGVAFLTIGNVTTGVLDFQDCRVVPEAYFRSLAPYRTPEKGDILYTVVGATYGRPAIVDTDKEFCVQRHIAILKPALKSDLRFMFWLMASPLVYEQASDSTTGIAQPTIALRPLRNFLVPLPPLQEQRRIAAKIDQLIGTCDALKAKLADVQTGRVRLADVIVAKAVS